MRKRRLTELELKSGKNQDPSSSLFESTAHVPFIPLCCFLDLRHPLPTPHRSPDLIPFVLLLNWGLEKLRGLFGDKAVVLCKPTLVSIGQPPGKPSHIQNLLGIPTWSWSISASPVITILFSIRVSVIPPFTVWNQREKLSCKKEIKKGREEGRKKRKTQTAKQITASSQSENYTPNFNLLWGTA